LQTAGRGTLKDGVDPLETLPPTKAPRPAASFSPELVIALACLLSGRSNVMLDQRLFDQSQALC